MSSQETKITEEQTIRDKTLQNAVEEYKALRSNYSFKNGGTYTEVNELLNSILRKLPMIEKIQKDFANRDFLRGPNVVIVDKAIETIDNIPTYIEALKIIEEIEIDTSEESVQAFQELAFEHIGDTSKCGEKEKMEFGFCKNLAGLLFNEGHRPDATMTLFTALILNLINIVAKDGKITPAMNYPISLVKWFMDKGSLVDFKEMFKDSTVIYSEETQSKIITFIKVDLVTAMEVTTDEIVGLNVLLEELGQDINNIEWIREHREDCLLASFATLHSHMSLFNQAIKDLIPEDKRPLWNNAPIIGNQISVIVDRIIEAYDREDLKVLLEICTVYVNSVDDKTISIQNLFVKDLYNRLYGLDNNMDE